MKKLKTITIKIEVEVLENEDIEDVLQDIISDTSSDIGAMDRVEVKDISHD